jgi:dienelactone hydrolase
MTDSLLKFIFITWLSSTVCLSAAEAERLFYLSNGEVLQGCVYKPRGKGPFPVIVFNQNNNKPLPEGGPLDPFPELAEYWIKHGHVLFLPGRQKKGDGDEDESDSAPHKKGKEADNIERERKNIHFHQQMAETIFAAIETVKAQSYVDSKRMFILGQQAGAVSSLLLAEKEVDVRGFVVFSPASGSWHRSPMMQAELKRAIKNAKAPIFLIQPENDHNLSPAEILGRELKMKGPPNTVKIYPPYGRTAKESGGFGAKAPQIWGSDVLSFFDDVLN